MTASARSDNSFEFGRYSDVHEATWRGHGKPPQQIAACTPKVPKALLDTFAEDVSLLLQVRLGPETVEAKLLSELIYLLTGGNDPIRFAHVASVYAELGGEFDTAFHGSYDRVKTTRLEDK